MLTSTGTRFRIYRFPFHKIDRAITEGAQAGAIKVLANPISGRIYGATILGANAGEMISEFNLAIRNKIALGKMSGTIHPYPTYALGNRRAADQWYVQNQTPAVTRWIQRLFGYRGVPPPFDRSRIV
jgi:pyruvate/2-oxoglutarate dehydrogenase complex dihydrolipoamide dehydrogenase (E3) component